MSDPSETSPGTSAAWLRRGQDLEAAGQLEGAIVAYDRAIASAAETLDPSDPAAHLKRRDLGLAWMNRGNALQKIGSMSHWHEAIAAYDEAIAVFATLPRSAERAWRNHLGAAWLNRGHAQMRVGEPSALDSFEHAIRELRQLPLDAHPHYRLNLAGAWTNLAHALLAPPSPAARERSRAAARSALDVIAAVERTDEAFAAMGLRARRALVMALGDLLTAAEHARQPITELAAEATDAIDDGLAIAREFEIRGIARLRPLALRLFRLGAQLYRSNQPQFLGEFVLENLAAEAFGADGEFQGVAREALAGTLAGLQQPQTLVMGSPETEKLLATARSVRAALHHLSLRSQPSTFVS